MNKKDTEISNEKKIIIYTDGACNGNPGSGGYASILIYKNHRKELSGGFKLTTNNRMELKGCIEGLKALKYKCKVTIYSDSKYVVNSIAKGWAKRWRMNGWKRNNKEYAKNVDLWSEFLDLCEKHEVELVWIKGHRNNTENENCDKLAKKAAAQSNLPSDEGYEKKKINQSSFL